MKGKNGKLLLEQAWKTLAKKIVNDPEMIEIFRYAAWVVSHNVSDELVLSEKGYDEFIKWFKILKNLNDFLLRGF